MYRRIIICIISVIFVMSCIILSVSCTSKQNGGDELSTKEPGTDETVSVVSGESLPAASGDNGSADATLDTAVSNNGQTEKQEDGNRPTIYQNPENTSAGGSSENADRTHNGSATTESQDDLISPAFVIESVEAKPGDKDVVVNIYIKNNPGILGTSFILHYDDSLLDLKKAESGEVFSALKHTPPKKLSNGCVFTWYGETLNKEDISDGVVLALHFDVSPEVSEGTFSVSVTGFNDNTYDIDLSEIELEVLNGSIHVN